MKKIEIYRKKDFSHVYNRINQKHYIMGIKESDILDRYNEGKTIEEDNFFLELLEQRSFFSKKKQKVSNIKIPIIKSFNPTIKLAKTIVKSMISITVCLLIFIVIKESFFLKISFAAPRNIESYLVIMLSMLFITLLHELSHAIVAKIYGVAVPEIGINFKFFVPLGYADISGVNYLNSKYKKINVILAGSISNLFVFGLLYTFNIFYYNELIIQIYSISLIMIVFNMFFYLKLDGYYFIEKIFEKENLINYNRNDFKGNDKNVVIIIYLCFLLFLIGMLLSLVNLLLQGVGINV